MAQHARLRVETGLDIYFCDPRSPWQRGTNENTDGLLRQYLPRAPISVNTVSKSSLRSHAHWMVAPARPRAEDSRQGPRRTPTIDSRSWCCDDSLNSGSAPVFDDRARSFSMIVHSCQTNKGATPHQAPFDQT